MKCPKCDATVPPTPDEAGFFVCASCGAKLRARPRTPSPAPAGVDPDAVLARSEVPSGTHPGATLPPGTPRPKIPRDLEETLGEILSEVRAVRKAQEEMHALLKERPAAPATGADEEDEAPLPPDDDEIFTPAPVVRSRRRKTVLLIDDDAKGRQAAEAALEHAEIPVRATGDGNGGVAAVAAEKPDVIVIDLALGGSLPARDVINMVKATMEWVDIPIVLYTGMPVGGQKEARTIHGADEYVPKSAGAEVLVAKVIALFRKG
jgi:CheY-like chemotaxis protein